MDLKTEAWQLGSISTRELAEAQKMFASGVRRAWISEFTNGLFFVEPHPDLRERLLETDMRVDADNAASLLSDVCRKDFRAAVSSLGLPSLLIYGQNDLLTATGTARRMGANIPQSELHVLTRTGHSPMMENPDALQQLVAGFANRLERTVAI
ncbi:MAG: 2-hydroxy-6-oxonona-2,4-dienedioate hydrolase [Actinomycetota bacterium]|jgi:pimeloyl-ACP methyl ester carboxylesterase|nr:2-hydroxy-6-oxonona-2,4-dienedioate hydrolase [Actinomycetota bacterium]